MSVAHHGHRHADAGCNFDCVPRLCQESKLACTSILQQEQSVVQISTCIQELCGQLVCQYRQEIDHLLAQIQSTKSETQHLRCVPGSYVNAPVAIPMVESHLDDIPLERTQLKEALNDLRERVAGSEVPVQQDQARLHHKADEDTSTEMNEVVSSEYTGGACLLKVSIISAWGLRNADYGLGQGTSDPYCICQPVGRPGQSIKTRAEQDTLHPVWNYDGFIPRFRESDDLEFCVYDKDFLKDDDLLGRVILKGSLLVNEPFEGDLRLEEAGEDGEDAFLRVKIYPVKEDDSAFFAQLRRAKSQWPQLRNKTATVQKHKEKLRHHQPIRHGDCTRSLPEFNRPMLSRPPGVLQSMVFPPDVRKKLVWDLMGCVLVATDVFMIPFMQAFDVKMTAPFLVIAFTSAIYWNLDMIGTFFTGFLQQGVIEMRIKLIARRYIQSWFFFDITIILVDWLFIVSSLLLESDGVGVPIKLLRILRSARAIRTLRVLSLLRVAKAKHIISYIWKMTRHPAPQAVITVLEALLIILTINHFVSCAWYWLGRNSTEEETWVKTANLQDKSILYQYGCALHWATTQFTPASMDIQPVNTQERYFTLLVDFFGLIVFSTFVSTITTNMTQVRALSQKKRGAAQQLNLYFREHMVSLELAQRIMSYLQRDEDQSWVVRTHICEVGLLSRLTPALLDDLKFEVFSPTILNHPFFYVADSITKEMTLGVCAAALSEMSWVERDKVFLQGQAGTGMHFVVAGTMSYHWDGGVHELRKDSWVAEPALWIEDWKHRGSLESDTQCASMKLDVAIFLQILKDFGTPRQSSELGEFIHMYASTFVRFSPDGGSENPVFLYTDMWIAPDELRLAVKRDKFACLREL